MLKEGKKNRWYILSVLFSLLPLITGCFFYALWRVTHDMDLAFLGLLLTPLCMLSLLISFIFLFPAAAFYKQNNTPRRRLKILLAFAILSINFPVAGSVMWEADNYYSQTAVIIKNHSGVSIDNLTITDAQGNTLSIPPVAAHSEVTHRLPFKGEGKITYKLISSTGPQEGILIGYFSASFMTPGSIIEINTDGTVTAEEISPALEGPF